MAVLALALAAPRGTVAQESPEEATPAAAPIEPTPPSEPEAERAVDRRLAPSDDQSAGGELGETRTDEPAAAPDAPGDAVSLERPDGDARTTDDEVTDDGGDAEALEDEEAEAEESRFPLNHFGHRLQGGIGLIAGSDYQFEIAYGGEKCRTADGRQESVCHHRAPVFFDFLLSFGATEGLEVLLEFRLGLLEDDNFNPSVGYDTVTSRPMAAGVGIRYLVSPMNRFKFFIGALLDNDFTAGLETDVYLRPIFGLQIEFVRYIGFFVQGSVNLSVIRYFGISLDGAGRFQIRFP